MPLICPACDKEIIPGSQVRMVIPSEEEDGERRIFTEDEIIAYHEACPTDEPTWWDGTALPEES